MSKTRHFRNPNLSLLDMCPSPYSGKKMGGDADFKRTMWPLITDIHSQKKLKGPILAAHIVHSVINFLLPTTFLLIFSFSSPLTLDEQFLQALMQKQFPTQGRLCLFLLFIYCPYHWTYTHLQLDYTADLVCY